MPILVGNIARHVQHLSNLKKKVVTVVDIMLQNVYKK